MTLPFWSGGAMKAPERIELGAAEDPAELLEAALLVAEIDRLEVERIDAAMAVDLAGITVSPGLRAALAVALRQGSRDCIDMYVHTVTDLYREDAARKAKAAAANTKEKDDHEQHESTPDGAGARPTPPPAKRVRRKRSSGTARTSAGGRRGRADR
jgi:hypothetical protein